ncbi:unnamed protein product [Chrysodeixis includens]|uniref:G-protein coupled receptors family 2 profile 2 domain-containing protein n=1 Tax=Chrysodeixis includens TaxID=689277 RepID=A0A9P0BSL9_CHRIL|nr:unnamed protein product [Chrysodeixis includens]
MFRYINILLVIFVGSQVKVYGDEYNITDVTETGFVETFIHKCCPLNQSITRRMRCQESASYNFTGFKVYDDDLNVISETLDDVILEPGKLQDEHFKDLAIDVSFLGANIYLMHNGVLKIEFPNTYNGFYTIEKDNFCVDNAVNYYRRPATLHKYYAILPDPPESPPFNPILFCSANGTTVFFLLLVLIIYAMLPELHNSCGMIVIMFVVGLLGTYLTLTILALAFWAAKSCMIMTSVIYYFSLSSYFWLTVMSFDIWWTFRRFVKVRPPRQGSETAKYVLYGLYAGVIPLLMTVGLVIVNNMNLKHLPWFITPHVPDHGCFLEGGSKFVYLVLPMMILSFWNWVFYVLAAFKERRLSRRTAVMDTAAAGSLQAQHTHKMRFTVYVKLSVVMTLYWLIEVISFKYPAIKAWYIDQVYAGIIGFLIFLILVCKSHIFKMLRNRYGSKKTSVHHIGPLSKIESDNTVKSQQDPATLQL